MIVIISDMRAANKPGYIARIVNFEKQFLHADAYTNHGKSHKMVTYDIQQTGIYEVCDANYGSRKRRVYFIEIKDGELVKESDTLADILGINDGLPELKGTESQVNWAFKIRQDYKISRLKRNLEIDEKIINQTSAKFWIENKDKLV